MSDRNDRLKPVPEIPGNELFPVSTASLVTLIGIIVFTFCLSVVMFFSY